MRRTLIIAVLSLAVIALLVTAGIQLLAPRATTEATTLPTINPTQAATQAPTSSAAEPTSPTSKEQAALHAATVMSTWTPATDFNRTASELRARDLMTPARAKKVLAPVRPATGEQWLTAAAANATSIPTATLNRATEKNLTSVTVTWIWKTKDGKVLDLPAEQRTYFFQLTETTPHKITDYDYE
jgi:hypothetical protein